MNLGSTSDRQQLRSGVAEVEAGLESEFILFFLFSSVCSPLARPWGDSTQKREKRHSCSILHSQRRHSRGKLPVKVGRKLARSSRFDHVHRRQFLHGLSGRLIFPRRSPRSLALHARSPAVEKTSPRCSGRCTCNELAIIPAQSPLRPPVILSRSLPAALRPHRGGVFVVLLSSRGPRPSRE